MSEFDLVRRMELLVADAGIAEQVSDSVTAELRSALTELRSGLGDVRRDVAELRRIAAEPPAPPSTSDDERLAAIEDAIAGLSEQLEALARDGATTTTARIDDLARGLGTLTRRLEEQPEQATAQDVSSSVRDALEALGGALDRGLGGLGENLSGAFTRGREADRAHLDEVVAALRATLLDAVVRVEGTPAAARSVLESEVATLRSDLAEALDAVRDRLAARQDQATGALLTEIRGLREQQGSAAERTAELAALGDRIGTESNRTRSRVDEVMSTTGSRLDELVATIGSRLDDLVSTVGARLDEGTAALGGRLDETRAAVRTDMESVQAAAEDALQRLTQTLQGVADRGADDTAATRTAINEVATAVDNAQRTTSDLGGRLDALETAVASSHAQLTSTLAEIRVALAESSAVVRGASREVDRGTEKLAQAGRGLVSYLQERDRLLEVERDGILREVLEDFALGLSNKDRKAMADRVGDGLRRRRDARDAERWRREHTPVEGEAAVDEVTDVAELLDLPERPEIADPDAGRSPEAPDDARSAHPSGAELSTPPVATAKQVAKRAAAKRTAATTSTVQRAAATGAGQPPARPKKTTARKARAKQAPAKRTVAKQAADDTTAKPTVTKKAAAKKAAAKKAVAKKAVAKKAAAGPPAAQPGPRPAAAGRPGLASGGTAGTRVPRRPGPMGGAGGRPAGGRGARGGTPTGGTVPLPAAPDPQRALDAVVDPDGAAGSLAGTSPAAPPPPYPPRSLPHTPDKPRKGLFRRRRDG